MNISMGLTGLEANMAIRERVRIMASKARRDIRMWFRCMIIVRIATSGARGVSEEDKKVIALRN